ncbi:hypothetical protein QZH56_03415 [Streptomyces olivoreticuli]|uniref:hypothetical protein n=1 Tax=Streptomyces olivoreticuli TaxID=68246 RepID=UPI002659BD11|nr:hypothetical protein [Streptomyces olivoreticuli]WKK24699.1 hypothetical protein QZH56_03415 [Streptomyces olivoreticuli]
MTTPTRQTPGTAPQTVAHHYIITIQVSGGTMTTSCGVIDVPVGATRAVVFDFMMKPLVEQYGKPIVVMFFALEPNAL